MLLVLACVAPEPVPAAPAAGDCAGPGHDRFARQETERGLGTPFERTEAAWGGIVATGIAPMVAEDLDADGDIDFLQGPLASAPSLQLNDGTGHFGPPMELPPLTVPESHPFLGILAEAAVDTDGDDLPEIFVVGRGVLAMYPNLGEGNFADPILLYQEHVDSSAIYQPLSAADFDGDGALDLALAGVTDASVPPGEDGLPVPVKMFYQRESAFVPGPDLVADGVGSVTLVTLATDRDADLDMDLFVFADRMFPNDVWRNDGVGADGYPVMVEEAEALALDAIVAAMGVDSFDLNGDGALDYCISDTSPPKCWLTDGAGRYYEAAAALGLYPRVSVSDRYATVGWSFDLVDLDNDGALDAVQASGSCTSQVVDGTNLPFPDLLWAGTGDGHFADVTEEAGFGDTGDNYSMVTADFDRDGAWEIVVGGPGAPPLFYQNTCTTGAWLDVRLAGPPGNRAGYGARVEVAGQVREMYGLRSPAQGPAEIHFGLGDVDSVDVKVTWPDGRVTAMDGVATRGRVVIGVE